jgi:hypothetical protein
MVGSALAYVVSTVRSVHLLAVTLSNPCNGSAVTPSLQQYILVHDVYSCTRSYYCMMFTPTCTKRIHLDHFQLGIYLLLVSRCTQNSAVAHFTTVGGQSTCPPLHPKIVRLHTSQRSEDSRHVHLRTHIQNAEVVHFAAVGGQRFWSDSGCFFCSAEVD